MISCNGGLRKLFSERVNISVRLAFEIIFISLTTHENNNL